MDQKISIKIAGRTFNLTAPTPETEQLYRQAAEAINKRFASFTRSHPGKTASDLLSLVAKTNSRQPSKAEINTFQRRRVDSNRGWRAPLLTEFCLADGGYQQTGGTQILFP